MKDLKNLSREKLLEIIQKQEIKIEEITINAKARENKMMNVIHNLSVLLNQLYSSKSEKHIKDIKKLLEELPDDVIDDIKELFFDEPLVAEVIKKRNLVKKERTPKSNHSDNTISKKDPDEVINIEGSKICPNCGAEGNVIDVDRKKILDLINQTKILEYIINVYKCPECNTIFRGNVPNTLNNTVATTQTLASIMINRIAGGIPLNRMTELNGFTCRQTITNWFFKGARILEPLANLIREEVPKLRSVHIDETKTLVINMTSKKSKLGYIITHASGKFEKKLVAISFSPFRNRDTLLNLPRMADKEIVVMSDAHSGYHDEGNIVNSRCMAHARRKFYQILNNGTLQSSDSVVTLTLNYISKLYDIEREIKNSTAEERRTTRIEKAIPIFNSLLALLMSKKEKYTGTPLGKAINYMLNNWEYLTVYLDYGNVEIDNNWAENCLRKYVIGRKNSLFSNNEETVAMTADLYTVIQTAQCNKLNLVDYLSNALTTLENYNDKMNIEYLLPWSEDMKNKYSKKSNR